MLLNEQKSEAKSLVVARSSVEVVISEDGASPLSLVMPPFEDMAEIDSLKGKHFSLRHWSLLANEPFLEMLRLERSRLLEKRSKFHGSVTFLNRIANLSAIAGDLDGEAAALKEAEELGSDEFISDRLIDNLIARERDEEAEARLLRRNLDRDIYANLRLGGMLAVRGEIDKAADHVRRAVRIDPLNYRARLFEGALHLWNADYERAIRSFRIAADRRPNSAPLYTNLAVAYSRLNQHEKALHALKMAVSIDPLSTNATTFLADVAHTLGRNEDAVPSLRYLVQYEQGNAGVWARLARALLEIGESGEAIAAIKRQASLQENSEVWNNLGVAHHRSNDVERAAACFKHAMTLSRTTTEFGFAIAAANFAILLGKRATPNEIIGFVDKVVTPENLDLFTSRKELSEIFGVKLRALLRGDHLADAISFAEKVMSLQAENADLTYGMALDLLTLYSVNSANPDRALAVAEKFSEPALRMDRKNPIRARLINNIAFVYAEYGRLAEAQRHLQAISSVIHKEAYPTATLGLVHLRKGDTEGGERLYEEACGLAVRANDRFRIRQKLNLELGKIFLSDEARKAQRFLLRAANATDGEDGLAKQASDLLKTMNVKGLPR